MKHAILIIVDTMDPDATARELSGTTVMTENGEEIPIQAAHTWAPPGEPQAKPTGTGSGPTPFRRVKPGDRYYHEPSNGGDHP